MTATATGGPTPDLSTYDIVLVNSSAGKDSQASLDVVAEAARAAGVLDRVVVVHADLGDAEWDGVPELAAEHAEHYGLRFELARRIAADGHTETILERVASRGMWPDSARRWCTSDHKRGPIRKIMTVLVAELRDNGTVVERPVRLLNVMGLRAAESPPAPAESPTRPTRRPATASATWTTGIPSTTTRCPRCGRASPPPALAPTRPTRQVCRGSVAASVCCPHARTWSAQHGSTRSSPSSTPPWKPLSATRSAPPSRWPTSSPKPGTAAPS